jgi:hypothetical protein
MTIRAELPRAAKAAQTRDVGRTLAPRRRLTPTGFLGPASADIVILHSGICRLFVAESRPPAKRSTIVTVALQTLSLFRERSRFALGGRGESCRPVALRLADALRVAGFAKARLLRPWPLEERRFPAFVFEIVRRRIT